MADKPGSPKPSDLMPLFVIFLIIIIVVSISSVSEETVGGKDNLGGGCVQPEPKIITNDIDTTVFEYTVVVECYESKKDAYWAAGRLRASQINNFVMEHKGAWHVCVGKYFSRKRAERQVAALKTHGVADPVIFPPGKNKCVPPETKIITINYTPYVLLAIVIVIIIAIATQTKKPSPPPPPPPPKVETTITITTATKPDVKEAKKDG
ncbi:SPOR domain-containing protein [candidate division KSB1 bacterium]|nr:SPOR domain-containing protein [candidate division KSB1 bacterium]